MGALRRTFGTAVAAVFVGGIMTFGGLSATPAAAAGCTVTSTNGTVTRVIGNRTYTLNVPAGLGRSAPLLIVAHGTGDTSAGIEAETGWTQYAARHHFIVAYPQGVALAGTWYFEQGSVDVTFLKDVVRDIESTWCVDTRRVYADGWSNGGIMSQRMACDAANVFAAVTSWEGTDPTDPNPVTLSTGTPCKPSRPISVGIFQGVYDPFSSPIVGLINEATWTNRNSCPGAHPKSTDAAGTSIVWQPCAAGTGVVWRSEFNTAHEWPAGAIARDLRDRLWSFLTANTLP